MTSLLKKCVFVCVYTPMNEYALDIYNIYSIHMCADTYYTYIYKHVYYVKLCQEILIFFLLKIILIVSIGIRTLLLLIVDILTLQY